MAFMKIFLRHFGRAIANLIDLLDPDVIVLGGGVSKFAALYTDGIVEVAKFVFNDTHRNADCKTSDRGFRRRHRRRLDRGLK